MFSERTTLGERKTASGLVVRENQYKIKGRDRNQPCPCNSGKKAKYCHAR